MRGLWLRMTAGDRLVVAVLLLAALGGLAWLATQSAGARVVVKDGEKVLLTAPLDQPGDYALEGPLGETRLVIDSRGARIASSPCALKVCMGMGPARHSGDLLACLPNRILVEIQGPPAVSSEHDLLSR